MPASRTSWVIRSGRWLLMSLCLCAPVRAEPQLNVSLTSADYPPLIDLSLPHGGLLTRIVAESFRLTNVEARFERVPNNRAITGVMKGMYDGSYGWAHSPERDDKLLYSERPIYANRMVLVQRRDHAYPWKRLADLAPFRIGVTLGNHYSDEFAQLETAGTLHTQEAASDAINLKKLVLGRIDLFPMEADAGPVLIAHVLKPAEQAQLTLQTAPFATVPVYLVIRRSHPQARELMARFDRGFRQLVESGQLQDMVDDQRQTLQDEAAVRPRSH